MIITFASQSDYLPKPKVKTEFVKSKDRVTFSDNVFASTLQNRNKWFFEMSKLLNYKDMLTSIMFNFNHDLEMSGGKYLGNQTKIMDLDGRINAGEFEIFSNEVVSTDPLVIQYADDITSYSTELAVEDAHQFEDGSGWFFGKVDWVGLAFLIGIPAGLGGTRIGNVEYNSKKREKVFDIEHAFSLNKNMNAKQFLEFLDSEESKTILTNSEVVSKMQSNEKMQEVFKDDNGNAYQVDMEAIFKRIVTKLDESFADFKKELTSNQQASDNSNDNLDFSKGDLVKSGSETYEVLEDLKFEKLENKEGEFLRTGLFFDQVQNPVKFSTTLTIENSEQFQNRLKIAKPKNLPNANYKQANSDKENLQQLNSKQYNQIFNL